jgi:GH24 family phage-related lysozyme (muramidase)
MHQSVRDTFVDFTTTFEGRVSTMYLDVLGLVTIGLGCLIDPITAAVSLPFVRRKTGEKANPTEITAEWRNIKSQPHLAKLHWKFAAAQCKLELEQEEIDLLALHRLDMNNATLLRFLPDFEDWPADAQLATHSMTWAMGAGFMAPHGASKGFPLWWRAAKKQDWEQCALQCTINPKGNPGVIPRNVADRHLFAAALTTTTPEIVTAWP